MASVEMVAGWQLLKKYRDVEERANEIGLKMGPSRYNGFEFDTIALFPKDECLPIYNREAEVFSGSLQDIDKWIRGVEWSRNYDNLMMSKNDEKRETAERKYQQRELLKTIRDGEKQKKIDR